MTPSMSRPANPYDNAACESFMKTLKQEEIYCNHMRISRSFPQHLEEFIGDVLQSSAAAFGIGLSDAGGV